MSKFSGSSRCVHVPAHVPDVVPAAACATCNTDENRRLCLTCGHVGCCDDSPHRHATKHFHKTRHPIIEGYDPPEGWGWCYIDEVMFDLRDRMTPHNGPIPRYV
jgi:hypothetical protein